MADADIAALGQADEDRGGETVGGVGWVAGLEAAGWLGDGGCGCGCGG